MGSRRTFVAVGAVVAAAVAAGVTPSVAEGRSSLDVLLNDLSSPKGVAINADGNPVVSQGAFGPPGPVLAYQLRGRGRGTTTPVSEPANLVDVAISPVDGTGWAIGSDPTTGAEGILFHQLADGSIGLAFSIPDYQATDPDPVDIDDPPFPTESNPYGLTVDRKGNALVADAAGNDVIRVTPDGVANTVARFDLQTVSTAAVPAEVAPPGALPPELPAEAVPTTVTVGPDGYIYVGELKGFPFAPGSSNVWRINPNATNAWCSVNGGADRCRVYADGFTAIQDIAFGGTGRLLVYELAADGVFAFEAGFATGQFPPAVLLEVRGQRRVELAPGELSQPGGIAVAPNGRIFVTDHVFTDFGGRLSQVR